MCVCVNVCVNLNIELMVTQTHTQRMGPRPIFCINQFIIEIEANIDTDAHLDVRCKQGFRKIKGVVCKCYGRGNRVAQV